MHDKHVVSSITTQLLHKIDCCVRSGKGEALLDLRGLQDLAIQAANLQAQTWCKWSATQPVNQGSHNLKQSHLTMGWSAKHMIQSHQNGEERPCHLWNSQNGCEKYTILAVSQQQEGKWSTWQAIINSSGRGSHLMTLLEPPCLVWFTWIPPAVSLF